MDQAAAKTTTLANPTFHPQILRLRYLDQIFAIIFNYCINIAHSEPIFATRFASIVMRSILTHVTSDKFVRDFNICISTKAYLKDKLRKAEEILNSICNLSDPCLDERDRRIVRRFPTLFWMEIMLNQDLDQIFQFIHVKQEPNFTPETDTRMRLKRLDQCIVKLLDEVEKATKLNNKYAAKMFAAILVRAFLNQVLSDVEAVDKDTQQYLRKRQFDFFCYSQTMVQISKGSMDDASLQVIDQHSQLFLCTVLVHPSLGKLLLKIITATEQVIEEMSPDCLRKIELAYEDSFNYE